LQSVYNISVYSSLLYFILLRLIGKTEQNVWRKRNIWRYLGRRCFPRNHTARIQSNAFDERSW